MSVITDLKQHILVDGFHIVVDLEKSHDAKIVDYETNQEYLDCYSQFGSQALGWNHPALKKNEAFLGKIALHKLANSDMYSSVYRDFVKSIASITPDFRYLFFVEGGSLAVENALKTAFDYKAQLSNISEQNLDVIHLKEAFHGRSGYALSVTNTGELKTRHFPKFNWTRVTNPKICQEVEFLEMMSLQEIEEALQKGTVAAILLETIQGEGGDNHFRKEYFQELRKLADTYQALLIFDEVQTGVAMTGKMWAYEHYDVKPDILVFGKKTQVCGIAAASSIDKVNDNVFHVSGRLNSTWGGNIVDMARAKIVIDAIRDDNLINNAQIVGNAFLESIKELDIGEVTNIRGKGLMIAFDLPNTNRRNEIHQKLSEKMMILKSGSRSIRFRPHLTFSLEDVKLAIAIIKGVF